MNIVYLIGVLLAFVFVSVGIMVDVGSSPWINFGDLKHFLDPASALIVVGGTLAVVIACYPKQARSVVKHFRIMLHANTFDPEATIEELTELAQIARKNGLLSLEERGSQQKDPFFRQAILLLVDATDPEKVRSILSNDIRQTSERHQEVIAMYERGSNAAPAFGMIGTLIGLIKMFYNLNTSDMSTIGPDMGLALITTFYGALLAHVVFNPVAANLAARDEEEVICREIILEGVMAIQSGENPKFLRERLLGFMNEKQREVRTEEPARKGSRRKKDKGDA